MPNPAVIVPAVSSPTPADRNVPVQPNCKNAGRVPDLVTSRSVCGHGREADAESCGDSTGSLFANAGKRHRRGADTVTDDVVRIGRCFSDAPEQTSVGSKLLGRDAKVRNLVRCVDHTIASGTEHERSEE